MSFARGETRKVFRKATSISKTGRIMRTNANRARFDDDGGNEKVNSPTTEEKGVTVTRSCIETIANIRASVAQEIVCRPFSASVRSNLYPSSFVKNTGKGIEKDVLLRM